METDSTDSLAGVSGSGRKHPFFQRSESTLCLGCPPPDPFASLFFIIILIFKIKGIIISQT